MNLTALKAWAKQPTTVLGIGSAIGTISHTIAQAIVGQVSWPVAAGGVAFSVVCMAIPDNTGAQSSVEKLVTDAVTAAAQKKIESAIPMLVQDGMAVFASLAAAPVVTAVGDGRVQVVVPPPAQPAAVAA